MRRHPYSTPLAIAFCLLAAPAAAQTIKPGLWEIQNKMGGSGDMATRWPRPRPKCRNSFPRCRRNSANRWKK